MLLLFLWLIYLSIEDIRHHSVVLWQLALGIAVALYLYPWIGSYKIALPLLVAGLLSTRAVGPADVLILALLLLLECRGNLLLICIGFTGVLAHLSLGKMELPFIPIITAGLGLVKLIELFTSK